MTQALPQGWESDVLTSLGAPVTHQNIANLDVWQQVEGGSTANPDKYNPFNTTLPEPGSYGTNSVGVQAFPSWSEGLDATVRTLEQPNMTAIATALRGSAPTTQFESSVNSSPWGTHFSGAPANASLTGITFPGGNADPFNWGLLGPGGGIMGQAATGAAGAAGGAFFSAIEPYILRSTLIVVGLVIVFIGLSQMFKGGQGPAQTAAGGTKDVTVKVKNQTQKAGEAAAPVVAA